MQKTIRTTLVNPPPLEGVYRHQLYLPMGLAYLAAVLEKAGHEVTVIYCPAEMIDLKQLKTKLAAI